MEPASVVRAILGGLLADEARIAAESATVDRWLADNARLVGNHVEAWAAARSVEQGLAAIAAGAAARPAPDEIRTFRRLPVAGQVVVALHEFCRLDDAEVARATARPLGEVELLLDTVGGLLDDEEFFSSADPPAPRRASPSPGASASAPAPPPAPPATSPAAVPPTVSPTLFVAPPAAVAVSTAPPRRRHRRRRSRTRPRWWIIASVVVLMLIAGGITASNLRDDRADPTPPSVSGLGDAAAVTRDQLSAGCGSAEGDAASAPTVESIDAGGDTRSYRIVAAATVAPGRPRPLLVDFGDLGQSLDDHVAETRFDDLAAALQLVVVTVAPRDGLPQWDVAGDASSPDAQLVDRILDVETGRRCIDQTRIMVVGRGAGAHFAAAYACARPGRVTALIMVAGAYRTDECATPSRLSVLAVLGAEDDVYPLGGGNSPSFGATFGDQLRDTSQYEPEAPPAALDAWADGLGCESSASQQIGLLTARINTTCSDDGEVWRVVIPGAGHEWYPATYDLIVQFLTTGPFPIG